MDVTKFNFNENLDKINEQINECDFLSIDCEFTGLFQPNGRNFELFNYEQLYENTRKNIEKFQIIQLGLSLFKMNTNINDENEKKFSCYSYNFYIFPTKCSYLPSNQCERYFQCQSSSLSFLIENGFDFNKLIREGITYVPLKQIPYVEEKIMENIDKNSTGRTNFIEIEKDEDKKFFNDINENIDKLMNDNESDEIEIPTINTYYKRIIYETVEKSKYKDSIQITSVKNNNKHSLILKKGKPKSNEELFAQRFLDAIGFTSIIKTIIKNQKPLIGHSLLHDILHIYNLFIEPLPTDYKEFKLLLNSCFNTIYDTSYISMSDELKNYFSQISLQKLFQTVRQDPFEETKFILKNSSSNDYVSDQRYHEAGYDSFITGCCFVQMIRFLFKQQKLKFDENYLNNNCLKKFSNKISIYGNYDIKFIDLTDDDKPLNRNHIFHLNFVKTFTKNDLNLMFAEFGGLMRTIFINDESAFCVLRDEAKINDVIDKLILNNKSTSFKVQHYYEFINGKPDNENIKKDDQKMSKDKSSSPKSENHNDEEQIPATKRIKLMNNQEDVKKNKLIDKLFDDNLSWTN